MLSDQNPHIRDQFISFQEEGHIYTINKDTSYTSVTTWNHSHFEHFNADKIIDKMMENQIKWQNNKYFGLTKQDIKNLWDKNKNEASNAGTKLHYDIECFYNNLNVDNKSIEFSYFMNFYSNFSYLQPFRTEWMIYHEELKLAGSIDMLYKNDNGSLSIYDWKRCKDIKKSNSFNKFAITECISHLPDTNFWHYALQLNTYKYILQQKYDVKIKDMYLVCLHPNQSNYKLFKIPDLYEEISILFQLRINMLSKKI